MFIEIQPNRFVNLGNVNEFFIEKHKSGKYLVRFEYIDGAILNEIVTQDVKDELLRLLNSKRERSIRLSDDYVKTVLKPL